MGIRLDSIVCLRLRARGFISGTFQSNNLDIDSADRSCSASLTKGPGDHEVALRGFLPYTTSPCVRG